MKSRKGFTLVELLVVIAILAILATASIIGFTAFTKKAQVSNDSDLVAQLNKYALAAGVSKDFKTVTDIRDELVESGFELANLKLEAEKQDYVIGFDVVQDKFVLLKGTEAAEGYEIGKKINVFAFVKTEEEATRFGNAGFSLYLQNGNEWGPLTVHTGIDVGENTGITSISYTNSATQEVVIRTNGGTLTINAENDTVKHYGSAKIVDIQKVAPSSYYEYGEILTAKIKQGRLVITEEANISVVKAVATDDEFTNIKLALVGNAALPTITRDAISIDSSTEEGTHTQLVLEVQKLSSEASEPTSANTEYVWASVTVNGSGEITDSSSVVASSKTELNESTKIVDAEISNSVVYTTLVHNEAELDAAVAAQAKYIMLANDISHAGPVQLTYSTTIDGDGHKLTSTGGVANEQTDSVTPGWKFYHSVIEIQAADIDVKITNIDLINNRSYGTAVGLVRTATNVNVTIENAFLDAKQYCVYTHVGSTHQNMTLNYVRFGQTTYNAFYWRGANGKLVANNTSFTSTNTTSTLTNEFTTFMLERPLLVNGEVFQSSGNDFTFNNCTFAKVQLGSNLQKLFVCGSENNTVRFNNTDFGDAGIVEFAGKMTTDNNTIDMAPSHVFVNGRESMPINAGYINVARSQLNDGRVYWPEQGLYSGTFSFDVSVVEHIYVGYTIQNNGNGTWSIVPQE